jgi:hypothetical protein
MDYKKEKKLKCEQINSKTLDSNSNTLDRNSNTLDSNTLEFVKGVVERINKINKDVSTPVFVLNKLKNKIKLSRNKVEDILVVNLEKATANDSEIITIEENDEIKVLTQEEYLYDLQKKSNLSEESPDAFRCLICMKTKLIINTRQFDCGHEFCNKCAIKWMRIKNNCPVCRKELIRW